MTKANISQAIKILQAWHNKLGDIDIWYEFGIDLRDANIKSSPFHKEELEKVLNEIPLEIDWQLPITRGKC